MVCTLDEPALRTRTYRRGVRAKDIIEDVPVVRIDSDAGDAARILAEHRLPGLVVTDKSGKPYAVLPAYEILRFILPGYVQDDLSLAGVLGESAADRAVKKLDGKTVGDLLPGNLPKVPPVDADNTIIAVAAHMARLRTPLIAVTKDGTLHGVITASRLLAAALTS